MKKQLEALWAAGVHNAQMWTALTWSIWRNVNSPYLKHMEKWEQPLPEAYGEMWTALTWSIRRNVNSPYLKHMEKCEQPLPEAYGGTEYSSAPPVLRLPGDKRWSPEVPGRSVPEPPHAVPPPAPPLHGPAPYPHHHTLASPVLGRRSPWPGHPEKEDGTSLRLRLQNPQWGNGKHLNYGPLCWVT